MKAVTFTSPSGNKYLFSPSRKTIVPIDSTTMTCIDGLTENETPLFKRLKDEGFLDFFQTDFSGRISGVDVRMAVTNLTQIVFEVTTACNLRCKYCCYGDGYVTFQNRDNGNLSFDKAKLILDYVAQALSEQSNTSVDTKLAVSFYGGEPLLNMKLIRGIVAYARAKEFKGRRLSFSMTTNAMCLADNMDFLAENDFNVLVSLDGGKPNNAYRIDTKGEESFENVMRNLKIVKDKYPKWFQTIRFNCVYTDISDIRKIVTFFASNLERFLRSAHCIGLKMTQKGRK